MYNTYIHTSIDIHACMLSHMHLYTFSSGLVLTQYRRKKKVSSKIRVTVNISKFLVIFFICIGVLPACMCMFHGTLCSRSPKLSVAYPESGITDGCEFACGC